MRFLLIVTIPVETGNAAAKAGKLGATIGSILAELKPEAAYFTDRDGQRAGYIILDLPDASHIPAVAEPFFLAFNAKVELHPVMVPADLEKASGVIDQAAKNTANRGASDRAAIAGGRGRGRNSLPPDGGGPWTAATGRGCHFRAKAPLWNDGGHRVKGLNHVQYRGP